MSEGGVPGAASATTKKRYVAAVVAVAVVLASVAVGVLLATPRGNPPPGPTQEPNPPASPAIVEAVAGDAFIAVSWSASGGAVGYHLYTASEPGVGKDNYAAKAGGQKLANVASPYTISGLVNGATYYVRVTAYNMDGESAESAEVSLTPQALIVPAATPLYVTGLVELDNRSPSSGAPVTVRAEDGSAAATGVTGGDGRYTVKVTPQFPVRVLAKATYARSGEPPATGFRWSIPQTGEGAVDVGRIVLPNPAGRQLALAGSTATSADGRVTVSGVPPTMASVWARSYVADEQPDVFPGNLAEGTSNPINNVVFLWISALDTNGNLVTEVSPPATVRLRVPESQWVDLEDLQPGNGVIDTPIYSLNYASGYWVREANGLLVDAAGFSIPEGQEASLRRGLYSGEVYAQFLTDHFSWWNVDKPPTTCGTDFGDADDPTYPSLLASDGARHLNICRAWLGPWADDEDDANVPNKDLYDDSVLSGDPLKIRVSNWNWAGSLYLNVLVDQASDGGWAEGGDWVVQNLAVSVPQGKSGAIETDASWDGQTWMRVTLTGAAISNYTGTGEYAIGETEDYPFIEYRLHVSVSGNGTVTSDPAGIDCRKTGGNCTAWYRSGTAVNLTASPDPGESFLGWGGDCSSAGTSATCSLTMDADRTASAAFTQAFYDLTVYVYGNGTVTSDPPGIDCHGGDYTGGGNWSGVCKAQFARDANVTLTETPDFNESFVAWGADCGFAGNNTTCALLMDRDHWVYAQFTRAPGLYVSGNNMTGSGNVTSDPAGIDCHLPQQWPNPGSNNTDCWAQFTRGTVVNLTAVPDPGSTFVGWSGDCTGTDPWCVLLMDDDKYVQAEFG